MAILGHSKQQFHREPTPLNRCYSINHQAPALQLGALSSSTITAAARVRRATINEGVFMSLPLSILDTLKWMS